MLRFIGNTIRMFFGLIFLGIPFCVLGMWLFVKYLVFFVSLMGAGGVFVGFLLLIAMLFAMLMD